MGRTIMLRESFSNTRAKKTLLLKGNISRWLIKTRSNISINSTKTQRLYTSSISMRSPVLHPNQIRQIKKESTYSGVLTSWTNIKRRRE